MVGSRALCQGNLHFDYLLCKGRGFPSPDVYIQQLPYIGEMQTHPVGLVNTTNTENQTEEVFLEVYVESEKYENRTRYRCVANNSEGSSFSAYVTLDNIDCEQTTLLGELFSTQLYRVVVMCLLFPFDFY